MSYVGFTCAYAPVALFDAAGLVPYRILPLGDAPDQAGTLVHDSMCPQIKRLLDRALASDLPPLSGVVFMESCDAMRRLADAWTSARPEERTASVDLPFARDPRAIRYFARELRRLARTLESWSGRPLSEDGIRESCRRYDALAARLVQARERAAACGLPWATYQELANRALCEPPQDATKAVDAALANGTETRRGVPVALFGNVLVDPQAFDLFAECGAHVVGADLCTTDRQLTPYALGDGDVYEGLATTLLSRPLCARTFVADDPDLFGKQVVDNARRAGAGGVIAHIMKFCDPYLARLPRVREHLREAGLPLLVLEGDCTLRSLGQHKTRIQAFVEMLAEGEA